MAFFGFVLKFVAPRRAGGVGVAVSAVSRSIQVLLAERDFFISKLLLADCCSNNCCRPGEPQNRLGWERPSGS